MKRVTGLGKAPGWPPAPAGGAAHEPPAPAAEPPGGGAPGRWPGGAALAWGRVPIASATHPIFGEVEAGKKHSVIHFLVQKLCILTQLV